jgi:EKC/KEOPS complex subunit CGI121/TPRKB
MQRFDLQCSFPTDPVYVFLFTEVSNAIALRSKLLAGDPDYRYAFLDASLVVPFAQTLNGFQIVSRLQVLAAVNRALHDERYCNLRTKHLHSEIVYALAATQNVSTNPQ